VTAAEASRAGVAEGVRPVPRPGRPRSARADEAILEAAIEELIEHGFASMTIERIAARAGVARSTVYRRWSNTIDLCAAALDHVRDPLPAPPGASVREDLIFLLKDIRRMLNESRLGRIIPELAAEARRHPDLTRLYWTSYVAPGSSYAAHVLHRGIASGELVARFDVELIIDLLTGPLFKRALWQLPVTDEDITRLVDVVLTGLAPVEGAGPAG
jgi:AcrR family transcriptional regulator